MKLAGILFDLDGTLADSVRVIIESNREAFEKMGLDFDEHYVRAQIGIPLETQAEMFAGERSDEFVEVYRDIYRRNGGEESPLFPGAADALRRLKDSGFRLALVTSKVRYITLNILRSAGIAPLFETLVTADDVARHKPDPEPILKALQRMRLSPEQAVYVGDALFDVEASSAAGVKMVGVSWGAASREALAPGCSVVVDTWDELVDWAVAAV